ncbi:hypothetical protein [Kitasatospora sp. NPDC093102]|uniref:hypothetical protein n=1 Tax=Kitasatospora sp. NPDC093102 TaxID=3155069 RepID=UPI0034429A90
MTQNTLQLLDESELDGVSGGTYVLGTAAIRVSDDDDEDYVPMSRRRLAAMAAIPYLTSTQG